MYVIYNFLCACDFYGSTGQSILCDWKGCKDHLVLIILHTWIPCMFKANRLCLVGLGYLLGAVWVWFQLIVDEVLVCLELICWRFCCFCSSGLFKLPCAPWCLWSWTWTPSASEEWTLRFPAFLVVLRAAGTGLQCIITASSLPRAVQERISLSKCWFWPCLLFIVTSGGAGADLSLWFWPCLLFWDPPRVWLM